jgi:signal transduction histidine kinase
MLNTVNRILEMSSIESNEYSSKFEEVDLKELISGLMDEMKVLADDQGHEAKLIVHQKDNTIISDGFLIEKIFSNLFGNAIKYTQQGGKIEVNLKRLSEAGRPFIRLSVEDNGKGIEERSQKKVFESFFTENEASKQKDQSTGLGLYLVKSYADYLGASVSIQSELGKGSVFTVDIPTNEKEVKA